MRRTLLSLMMAIAIGIGLVPASATADGPILVAVAATPEQGGWLADRFDLAEARDGEDLFVVAWPGDVARLRSAGFEPRVVDIDLMDMHRQALSTGHEGETRTSYRTYAEYQDDLRGWATENPDMVRVFTLPELTLEGREVLGVEISIGDPDDGRPKAYIDGIHHAREWPAGELVMAFVEDLLDGVEAGDARIVGLLQQVSVIAIPVVNPDGFIISRGAPWDTPLTAVGNGLGAYWRKNARGVAHFPEAHLSVASYGVDNNRNYPFMWGSGTVLGGNGASGFILDADYEGTAPASEPETRNVKHVLLSENHTAVVSNHTYGNLILYPWGHTRTPPADIAELKGLAEHMAEANGYTPQPGMDLYATTGTTDDWAYAATGTLGFTFEHGTQFHPPYLFGVELKRPQNLEAMLRLLEAAADPGKHSVIEGRIVDEGQPVAAWLSLVKNSVLPASSGPSMCSRIDLELETRPDGTFSWHVNPSVGPIDDGDYTLVAVNQEGGAQRAVRVLRGGIADLGDIELGDDPIAVPAC
jgi:hypothetical protein